MDLVNKISSTLSKRIIFIFSPYKHTSLYEISMDDTIHSEVEKYVKCCILLISIILVNILMLKVDIIVIFSDYIHNIYVEYILGGKHTSSYQYDGEDDDDDDDDVSEDDDDVTHSISSSDDADCREKTDSSDNNDNNDNNERNESDEYEKVKEFEKIDNTQQ
tara:strand:+ start:2834 stop:3319 length:486 start_codon:yes stop_codon:yes gene_type:complete